MTNKETSSKKQKTSKIGYGALLIVVSILIVTVAIWLVPDPIQPIAYDLPEPPRLIGPLLPNEKLKPVVRMFDDVIGAESMVFHEDNLYTGTDDGKILKINREGQVSTFAKWGHCCNCSSLKTCSRPLGIRVDPTNKFLVVADAYQGLYKIDLASGNYEKVFPFDDNFQVTFFDDFDFLPNGDIIVSEASTRYTYERALDAILESRDDGRLIRVNLNDRRYEVIQTGLYFANGVQKDFRDGGLESILLAEYTRNRIIRVFVDGPRQGQTEIFSENLPGVPDNIRPTETGDGYWVALTLIRSQEYDAHAHAMRHFPFLRLMLLKLIPRKVLINAFLPPKYAMAIKINLKGDIVESLHDTNASSVQGMTQITEHNGSLYFGTVDGPGIGRLDLECKKTKSCFFQMD